MMECCDPHESLVCISCGSMMYSRNESVFTCLTPGCHGMLTCVSVPFAPIAMANLLAGAGASMRIKTSVSEHRANEGRLSSAFAQRALLDG